MGVCGGSEKEAKPKAPKAGIRNPAQLAKPPANEYPEQPPQCKAREEAATTNATDETRAQEEAVQAKATAKAKAKEEREKAQVKAEEQAAVKAAEKAAAEVERKQTRQLQQQLEEKQNDAFAKMQRGRAERADAVRAEQGQPEQAPSTRGAGLALMQAQMEQPKHAPELILRESTNERLRTEAETEASRIADEYAARLERLGEAQVEELRQEWGWKLIQACKNGNSAAVVKALTTCPEKGAPLMEATDEELVAPLSWAAASGHVQIVELLLSRGAPTELRCSSGRTALLWAALYGMVHVVVTLIQHGADIEAKCSEGVTPLNAAASGGFADAVQVLIAHGADPLTEQNGGHSPSANAEYNQVDQNQSKYAYDAKTGVLSEDEIHAGFSISEILESRVRGRSSLDAAAGV